MEHDEKISSFRDLGLHPHPHPSFFLTHSLKPSSFSLLTQERIKRRQLVTMIRVKKASSSSSSSLLPAFDDASEMKVAKEETVRKRK